MTRDEKLKWRAAGAAIGKATSPPPTLDEEHADARRELNTILKRGPRRQKKLHRADESDAKALTAAEQRVDRAKERLDNAQAEARLQSLEAAIESDKVNGTAKPNRKPLSAMQDEVWKILKKHTTKYDRDGMPKHRMLGKEIADELFKTHPSDRTEKDISEFIERIIAKGWLVGNEQDGQGYYIPKGD